MTPRAAISVPAISQRQPGLSVPALIVIQCLALLAIGLATLNSHWIGMHIGDMDYYLTAAQHVVWGQTPYRDFDFAYPPLSLLAFCLPAAFHPSPTLDFWPYVSGFLYESIVWSTLIAAALAGIAGTGAFRLDSRQTLQRYLLLVLVSSLLLPWRYDLFPILLTVVSLQCVLSGRPGLAGLCLGLGVAAKLYPIVLLPIFTLYYAAGKQPRPLWRFQAGHWAAIIVCLLPFIHVPLHALLSFFRFHEQRGLEVETLPAGLIMLAHRAGWVGAKIVTNYGACHLMSPLSRPIIGFLPLLFGLTYAAALIRCWQTFRQEQSSAGRVSPESVVYYLVTALIAFIVCNKVFSTQYIFWVFPFIPLLRPRLAALLSVVFVLTCAIYPYAWPGLVKMHLGPLLLLNGRNILLACLLIHMLRRSGPATEAAPPAEQRRSPSPSGTISVTDGPGIGTV